ncbi:receptor-type tyrosine-protein phosphatase N2 isoform X2 [Dipodomys merriami]|uniref:receptor-type tyrosine-protein phosphatase N2 isoform X2 n=1 Tax=Dipodomys merriami TaxID=94247 RepID=UPI003855D7E4
MRTFRYEESPGDLQRLRVTLQKLSRAGLTWQDDHTQRGVDQELSSLPRAYPRHPEAAGPPRAWPQDADREQPQGLQNEIALAQALQRYLPYLGVVSGAASPRGHARVEQGAPPAKGQDPFPDNVLTYVARASALSYPPGLRASGRLQPDKLSPEEDIGVDRRRPPGPPREGSPALRYFLHNPASVPRLRPAPEAAKKQPSPAGGPGDAPGAGTDAILQSLLKDPRKHLAGGAGPGPLRLDEVADEVAPGPASLRRGPERHPGERAGSLEMALQDHGEQEDPMDPEVHHPGVRLGGLLQERGPLHAPDVPALAKPFKAETKKSQEPEEPEASQSSEEEAAGVENVKSQTYSRDLLGKRPTWEPRALGDGRRAWAPGPSPQAAAQPPPPGGLQLAGTASSEGQRGGYIVTGSDPLSLDAGKRLLGQVARLLQVPASVFVDIEVLGPAVTFKVSANPRNVTAVDVEKVTVDHKEQLESSSGLTILQSGVGPRARLKPPLHQGEQEDSTKFIVLTFLSIACIAGVLLASGLLYCLRHGSHRKLKERLSGLGAGPSTDATAAYQAYMEDHLRNKNRLDQEWEALCTYQAEPNSSLVAQREENMPKNRSLAVLTYDHSRILLKAENSLSGSDYINASPIMDHDPKSPAYIATQGPLPATVADFWQMVWESSCALIAMLTPLAENGVRQCHHYWPDEGSNLYHIYEVNLVSEHIWCQDFLVRSFYLKNLQTNETRTVTQFHFLSWHNQGVPSSTRSLLDFRRKVNKSYRGRSCPIIVHCSDGAGRSGTYILIDMVLNKMAKGAKEIDIAATLEHLRDQRPGMVQTKEQFEFALTAVAEEVNAILKALPQ